MTTLFTTISLKTCCDLLKIHYLCGWNDNLPNSVALCIAVVICSKFITFVVEMTTNVWTYSLSRCCDLLKIHYLCGWNDNFLMSLPAVVSVVICSKFITFVVEMTTSQSRSGHFEKLWFAQNSLPLWLKWQPSCHYDLETICCDLLKIHYLCGWNDNFTSTPYSEPIVVICSKFITFVVEMTT